MEKIKSFTDLDSWRVGHEFVLAVYKTTQAFPAVERFALANQLQRAAVGITSNIAEGFGTGSDADFVRFLGYARRSASETQSQLYAALDQYYISSEKFDEIYSKANMTERQINALIGYLSRSKDQRSVREETTDYTLDLPDDIQD